MSARYNPRKEHSLKRSYGFRIPKKSFLIVCEGENTEPEYFNAFRLTSATVKAVGKGLGTMSLVKEALAIRKNQHRDEVTNAHLEALGWHVITVWECELRGKSNGETRLDELADEIRLAGEKKARQDATRQQSRTEAKKMREEMLRRQAQLESEIDLLYSLPERIKRISMEG